ncbi:hypothetical protein Lbys_3571 [Leadbetterella byssophila DSM 17132]|uniref:Uncharacterized protein n=1 Tax=Leadbetterella byssophila (strain DSM 17132 / JCM 16389 / KACC 11308 / NBRC 106382 / 4M15) TaxID=649349 RepID=E4RZS7_LEAB4|nr:hypothetical protein Lbys_3571 [Leadbetterella byssophila DSM 17132]
MHLKQKKHKYSFSTFLAEGSVLTESNQKNMNILSLLFWRKKVAKKHEFYDVLFRFAQTDHKIRSKEH